MQRNNVKEREAEIHEVLVGVRRVAKVVKGGRRFGFSALVVVGDGKGRVGFSLGKAGEVPDAVRKATERAKKKMFRVPLREGRTLHHDVVASDGAGEVLLRAAPAGTGIIAGGAMRAVFRVMGIRDVVTKSRGSNNPLNMIAATFSALKSARSPRQVAANRGMSIGDIISRREQGIVSLNTPDQRRSEGERDE